ncbi:hypothetical protein [Mycobacteroides franklinii]|uniref:hypothetical protein n=1 Tax=Mycobacteroides franklinii TaxID=948102 RepID=UPI001F2513E5|nr:hypothetical protein [Mycobacteroides franklinii]
MFALSLLASVGTASITFKVDLWLLELSSMLAAIAIGGDPHGATEHSWSTLQVGDA